MARVQSGDKACFSTLMRRHLDALYTYAMRLTGVPATAEDLVQDTCLAAWQHAARYRPRKAKVTTWLHSILHNKFVDSVRKHSPDIDEAAVNAAVTQASIDTQLVNAEQQQILLRLIGQLPVNQRCAILLSYMQGFSNREVAKIMSVNPRALESLLARARTSLKDKLNLEGQAAIRPADTL